MGSKVSFIELNLMWIIGEDSEKNTQVCILKTSGYDGMNERVRISF